MIGNYIKAIDNKGQQCEGIILDKIQSIDMIQAPNNHGPIIGQPTTIPVPVDLYLVYNKDAKNLHLVNPVHISALVIIQPELMMAGSGDDIEIQFCSICEGTLITLEDFQTGKCEGCRNK